jgi:hypothetical protein
MGLPLSVICSGCPIERESHKFWLKLLKLVFSNITSKFLYNVNIKYQQINAKGRPLA